MRRSELAALNAAVLACCAASAAAAFEAKTLAGGALPNWAVATYVLPNTAASIRPPLRAPDPGAAYPNAGGLRAYFDPATGRLRDGPQPNQPEYKLPSPVKRNFNLIWEERLLDGSGLVHLEGQMQMTSIATLDPSGQVKIECLPGAVDPAPEVVGQPAAEASKPNEIAAPHEREQSP